MDTLNELSDFGSYTVDDETSRLFDGILQEQAGSPRQTVDNTTNGAIENRMVYGDSTPAPDSAQFSQGQLDFPTGTFQASFVPIAYEQQLGYQWPQGAQDGRYWLSETSLYGSSTDLHSSELLNRPVEAASEQGFPLSTMVRESL